MWVRRMEGQFWPKFCFYSYTDSPLWWINSIFTRKKNWEKEMIITRQSHTGKCWHWKDSTQGFNVRIQPRALSPHCASTVSGVQNPESSSVTLGSSLLISRKLTLWQMIKTELGTLWALSKIIIFINIHSKSFIILFLSNRKNHSELWARCSTYAVLGKFCRKELTSFILEEKNGGSERLSDLFWYDSWSLVFKSTFSALFILILSFSFLELSA